MKKPYQAKRIAPYFLFNFQLLRCVATRRNTIVRSNVKVEYVRPVLNENEKFLYLLKHFEVKAF